MWGRGGKKIVWEGRADGRIITTTRTLRRTGKVQGKRRTSAQEVAGGHGQPTRRRRSLSVWQCSAAHLQFRAQARAQASTSPKIPNYPPGSASQSPASPTAGGLMTLSAWGLGGRTMRTFGESGPLLPSLSRSSGPRVVAAPDHVPVGNGLWRFVIPGCFRRPSHFPLSLGSTPRPPDFLQPVKSWTDMCRKFSRKVNGLQHGGLRHREIAEKGDMRKIENAQSLANRCGRTRRVSAVSGRLSEHDVRAVPGRSAAGNSRFRSDKMVPCVCGHNISTPDAAWTNGATPTGNVCSDSAFATPGLVAACCLVGAEAS
ncbi:hypothetical protein K461DRAFT_266361 [Myriangium duriaei CBS 260.36]|uniref:Uncharacterized protein n=1 Tax=Myriangium duriaei CBS 260.36 TaxID=1168546 RepID=A0A9P4J591_9PEZI|nr:hypothetical protein K461DRAFT_266361 [Myriangium duriaei CBS 260.36]